MIDFDDIIQYHARNLYELFYKRKGQQKSYSLKKRSQKRNRLTPNEIKERKREYNRQYRQRNKEKFREYNRQYRQRNKEKN